MTPSFRRVLGLITAGIVAVLLVPAPAGAQIPAGFDIFETDPDTTMFNFDQETTLPPDFFGPGSDPFTGEVNFAGAPAVPLPGFGPTSDLGATDTIVRRDSDTPPNPNGALVEIELVALSLRSVQPIEVTFNGGAQDSFFDVFVGVSQNRPSKGFMEIYETSPEGGDFNSSLLPIPIFTFRKVGDGPGLEEQILDVGQFPPSPFRNQIDAKTQLQAFGTPYSYDCGPPVHCIPGFNDVFVPGFKDGQKVLTIEQAALAAHGIYPAQPLVEHFKCYKLKRKKFGGVGAQLTDQFGTTRTKVRSRKELCNPAQKRSERFVNERNHLASYKLSGKAVGTEVAVLNQFGSQLLRVGAPERLLVPTEKKELPRGKRKRIRVSTDHFQCYGVTPLTPVLDSGPGLPDRVRVADQFRREGLALRATKWLCAPVEKRIGKEVTPSLHPVQHLVCYRAKGKRNREKVKLFNQLERTKVAVKNPKLFCVPSAKQVLDAR